MRKRTFVRIAVNVIAALVIVGLGALAIRTYTPAEPVVRGSSAERLERIARLVTQRHEEYVAVPDARLETVSSGQIASFVLMVVVPSSTFLSQPQSQQQAEAQQNALRELQGAIVDLLKLTTANVLRDDPTVVAVLLKIVLPTGQVVAYVAPAEQLKRIPKDAAVSIWTATLIPLTSSSSEESGDAAVPEPRSSPSATS